MANADFDPQDVARAATLIACRTLGDFTPDQRALVGYFALVGARAGNLDAERLAVEALGKAQAYPHILGAGRPLAFRRR